VAAVMEAEHCKEYPVHLDIASCYLGESTDKDFKDINHFLQNNGFKNFQSENTAWCAAFVNSALHGAGIEGNGSEAAASFLQNYGSRVKPKDVQPGDIVVMPRNDEKTLFHVAMVVDTYQDKSGQWRVHYIGGNQGSDASVCIHDIPLSYATGFTRPPEADFKLADNPSGPGNTKVAASRPVATAS
jgi:uncharacterized protein (TIGR02594 family)